MKSRVTQKHKTTFEMEERKQNELCGNMATILSPIGVLYSVV